MLKHTHNVTQFRDFEFELLKGRRFAFAAKIEKGKNSAEKPSAVEKELSKNEIEKKLNEGKEKGVKLTKDVDQDLLELAKKVYKTKEAQDKYKDELRQAYVDHLPPPTTPESFWEFLNSQRFERITITNGKFTYIKGKLETSEIPKDGIKIRGVEINEIPVTREDKKAPIEIAVKAVQKETKPAETKEPTKEQPDDQNSSLEMFKKRFPAKAGSIKVSVEQIGEGSGARIPQIRNLPLYLDNGSTKIISSDVLGDFKKSSAKITKPFIIEAPNDIGQMTKYVYVEAEIEGSIQKGQYKGWVELSRLSDAKLTKPEEKVAIAVKTEKIEAEEKKVKEILEVQKARRPYLDETGIVHLKAGTQTKEIKLQTLFPNAKVGDSVMVTSKITGATTTARFNNNDWLDTNKKHVPIYNGDKIILTSRIDYEKEKPKAPALNPNEKLIETTPRQLTPEQVKEAKNGTLNWNKIAKDLMGEFPKIKESDIKSLDYAKLLAKHSTETGYYWVIEPAKVKPSAETEAKAEIATGKKEAVTRTKKAKKEAEQHDEEVYKQQKEIIWGNGRYYFGEKAKINEYVNDPKKWKEAWNKNYPINSKLILKAFRHEPFNNIPETKIRDGVREMIYTTGVITVNFFKPSDLFDKFNKNGEFYMNMEKQPGSLIDFKKEWKLITEVIPEKIEKNKERGKAQNHGFSEKEEKAFQTRLWGREEELHQIAVGIAGIFEAIGNAIKPESEEPKVIKVVPEQGQSRMSKEDGTLAAFYQEIIYDNKNLSTPDVIDEYINDQKKWDDMWDHDKGNIGILKKALQRPPFNKTSLGAHKTKIREAMHDALSKNDINMSDLLNYLNEDGKIYKNKDGEPGRLSDFKDEFRLEQIGNKVRKGITLTEYEQKKYDQQPNKEQLGDRYDELVQLWVSAAHIFDAISKLDPTGTSTETIAEGKDPSAYVNQIFPSSDTGSINGVAQDYYDTTKKGGERIAGGGVFTGGLFRYDFRDSAKGISDMDRITSNATANRIILDQCGMNEGKVDKKRLQARLNELIMLGISSLITQPESTERTKALNALGITKEDLDKPDVVVTAAKKHEVNFNKSKTLTPAQKDLVRLGFLLETVAKPGVIKEGTEVVEWAVDPKVRLLQKEALRINPKMTKQDLEKIEKEMNNKIIAFLDMKVSKNFSGVDNVGFIVPVKIAGEGKNAVYLAVGPSYSPADNKFVLRAGIGGSVEVAKGTALIGGVGVTTEGKAFAGAGVSFDIPVDKKTVWKPNLTVGAIASTDFKGYDVIVGGALMLNRNLGRQFKEDLDKNLEKNGYAAVEKATGTHEKAELLRKLPGPNGGVIAQIDATLGLTDEQLVNLYEQHLKKRIELSTAEAGLAEHKFLGFLPPITSAGGGVGLRLKEGEPPTLIPGLAFAISIGSELVIFQRPVTSTEAMIAGSDERMEKQAEAKILSEKQFIAKAKESGFSTPRFESATFIGDMESGLKPIKRETAKVENKPTLRPDESEIEKAFQELGKELAQKGIQLEKVGDLYRLRILNVGNYEVYVDPQMKEKTGVFLRNGDIFISANKNPKLIFKRTDLYYPRPKEGNIKHTIVTISDADFRTQRAIMDESDYFLDSRTLDATGAERTALSFNFAGERKTPKQWNLREWNQKEAEQGLYGKWFENLNTTTAEMLKYREQAEKEKVNGEIGQKVVEKIGTADMQAIDINKVHGMAELFMKKHPKEYREYTTYKFKTDADFKKLNTLIKKDFPDATEDETIALKEELFNLSMTEAEKGTEKLSEEKKLEKKKELVHKNLEWMKTTIYVPFFKKNLTKENNPKGYTPEQVAEAYIAPLRAMTLENPESVPPGTRLDVAVGSENIVGQRGVIVGNPDSIKNHRIFVAKDYSQALMTGEPPIDKTIALVFRESQRPFEKLDDTHFLKSSLALKLMLLGNDKNNPVLIKLLGVENYKKLSTCFDTKPPVIAEGASKAVDQLRDLAKKLSDAQTGKGGTTILIDGKEYQSLIINDTIIGIRTASFKSGVYERCLNASNMYNDEIVALSNSERPVIVGKFRSYNSAAANSFSSSEAVRHISIGAGVTFEVGPTAPKPPPTTPGTTPETPGEKTPTTPPGGKPPTAPAPSGGPGGEVTQAEQEKPLPTPPPGSEASE